MCLSTYWRKAKVADHDIVCYKIVTRYRGMKKGTYKSYWMNYDYSLGEHYYERLFVPDLIGCESESKTWINGKPTFLCDYGFHSYSEMTGHSPESGCVFIKCVIPQGTRYYESTQRSEYCSEKIRVIAQAKITPVFDEDNVEWITEFN